MPVKKIATLQNFRELNNARPSNMLSDAEFSYLLNWYPESGELRMRPTMRGAPILDGGGALLEASQWAMTLGTGLSTWNYISYSATKITKTLLVGTSVPLTDAMSLGLTGMSNWRSTQYKGYGYAVSPSITKIIRHDETNFWSTGIAAPSTNAAIADGGAGTGEAGTFYGVYTFVDADGVESAPSPVSAAVTVAASRFFAWTSVDVSTNPRVVARNLYRTLPNQTGEYFYVAQIGDNTATTYNEAILTTDMGDLAPVDNLVPATKAWLDIETQFERLWVTDGSLVYGSAAEDPDSWPADNVYAFSPDDGQPIKALRALGEDLIVVKRNSVWALSQSLGAFEFLPRLVDGRNGTVSDKTVVVAEGRLFFVSGDALFVTDGKSPAVDVSTGRITEIQDNTSVLMSAAADTAKGWYLLNLGHTDAVVLVYDYRNNRWLSKFDYGKTSLGNGVISVGAPSNIQYMNTTTDVDGKPAVIAGIGSGLSTPTAALFFLSETDTTEGLGDYTGVGAYVFNTPKVTCKLRTRGVDFGAPGLMHTIARTLLHTSNPVANGTYADTDAQYLAKVQLEVEDTDSGWKNRTSVDISSSTSRAWKNLSLSSRAKKSTLTRLYLERTSRYELIIRGIQLHGEVWGLFVPEGL